MTNVLFLHKFEEKKIWMKKETKQNNEEKTHNNKLQDTTIKYKM